MGVLKIFVDSMDQMIPYLNPIDLHLKSLLGPNQAENSSAILALSAASIYVIAVVKIVDWWDVKKIQNEKLNKTVAKRKHRDDRVHDCLSEEEKYFEPIKDAIDVLKLYKDGIYSCADIMLYSINRSSKIGNQLLSAVTEEFYDEALSFARAVDEQRKNGKLNIDKPLLGIPISIKDCFQQQGADCTLGIACRCFEPSDQDGLQVRLLREAGAIPFVRSNVPQLLMMPESENRIWGQSLNPWDVSRTPGGSSGGEGALIATHCSVMGLGSDIGGSIRIPAHYCGICGFKPTPNRVTHNGSAISKFKKRNGQVIITPTAGPMARSVRDCNAMMEALTAPNAFLIDTQCPPLGWNSELATKGPSDNKKLRVAMMVSDGWCEPVASVKRAVLEAAEVLRKAGHEVVEFMNPISTEKMLQTYIRLISADGNWYSHMRSLEGEDLHNSYKTLQKYTDIPNWARPVISFFLETFTGEYRKSAFLQAAKDGGLSTREYWEAIADMREIVNAYVNCFQENQYDALLMPVVPHAAPIHGMAPDLIGCLSYTFLANLLHWPAGTVPITLVQEAETNYDVDSLPSFERDSLAVLMAKTTRGSVGMPVGVQVMTPMWRDELCMHLLSVLEEGIQFDKVPPQVK